MWYFESSQRQEYHLYLHPAIKWETKRKDTSQSHKGKFGIDHLHFFSHKVTERKGLRPLHNKRAAWNRKKNKYLLEWKLEWGNWWTRLLVGIFLFSHTHFLLLLLSSPPIISRNRAAAVSECRLMMRQAGSTNSAAKDDETHGFGVDVVWMMSVFILYDD